MWTPPPDSAETNALSAIARLASGPSLDPTFRVTVNFHPDRKAGERSLLQDVEALVLDECYRGTQVELDAMKLPVCIEWHSGFRVSVDTIRQFPGYRGEAIVTLAANLAVEGWITPAIIGMAAASAEHSYDDLKKVWHYVARFAV